MFFKLIYSHIENLHKNIKFLSNSNKFWVLKISDSIIQLLNNINNKCANISALYTMLPHDKLKSKLPLILDFAFKRGGKSFIRISINGAAY